MDIVYIISQWILISVVALLFLSIAFLVITPIGKRLTIRFIDWYIRSFYSHDYIHRDMIREEITKRIDEAVLKINLKRDEEETNKLNALKIIHKIEEDGYIAEIMRLEKNDIDVEKIRKKVEDLYFKVVKRANELVVSTARNWNTGEKIISDVTCSAVELKTIQSDAEKLVKEIKDAQISDYDALGLNESDVQ